MVETLIAIFVVGPICLYFLIGYGNVWWDHRHGSASVDFWRFKDGTGQCACDCAGILDVSAMDQELEQGFAQRPSGESRVASRLDGRFVVRVIKAERR